MQQYTQSGGNSIGIAWTIQATYSKTDNELPDYYKASNNLLLAFGKHYCIVTFISTHETLPSLIDQR